MLEKQSARGQRYDGLEQEQREAKPRGDYFTSVPNSHGENDPKQKKKWENRGVGGAVAEGVQPQQHHQAYDEHRPSSDDLLHSNMCEPLHARSVPRTQLREQQARDSECKETESSASLQRMVETMLISRSRRVV